MLGNVRFNEGDFFGCEFSGEAAIRCVVSDNFGSGSINSFVSAQ
jgi:hypothetical protein